MVGGGLIVLFDVDYIIILYILYIDGKTREEVMAELPLLVMIHCKQTDFTKTINTRFVCQYWFNFTR